MIELYEDYFEQHPEQQVRREIHEDSGAAYFVTGDPVADRWERQIAAGEIPDFDEGVPSGEREAAERRREAEWQARQAAEAFQGIDERFDDQ